MYMYMYILLIISMLTFLVYLSICWPIYHGHIRTCHTHSIHYHFSNIICPIIVSSVLHGNNDSALLWCSSYCTVVYFGNVSYIVQYSHEHMYHMTAASWITLSYSQSLLQSFLLYFCWFPCFPLSVCGLSVIVELSSTVCIVSVCVCVCVYVCMVIEEC